MDTNLDPVAVVAWMREQAASFTRMAEQIESTFKLNGRSSVRPAAGLADRMLDLLADGRNRRANEIAHQLNASESAVRSMIDLDGRFVINERGWVSCIAPARYKSKGGDGL